MGSSIIKNFQNGMILENCIMSRNFYGHGGRCTYFLFLSLYQCGKNAWSSSGERLFGHHAVSSWFLQLQDEVSTGPVSPLGLSEIPCGVINHHLVEHLVLSAAWRNVQMWWPANSHGNCFNYLTTYGWVLRAAFQNVLHEHLCA